MTRCAHSLIEVLIAVALFAGLLGATFALRRSGAAANEMTLGPQMGLQMSTRRALMEFIKELQECVEFTRPAEGTTLTYLLCRDKLDRVTLAYAVVNDQATAREGVTLHDLYVYVNDPAIPVAARQRLLFGGIARLDFTVLGSGVIQIRMDVYQNGRDYPLLTTVRARNIALEGEL